MKLEKEGLDKKRARERLMNYNKEEKVVDEKQEKVNKMKVIECATFIPALLTQS